MAFPMRRRKDTKAIEDAALKKAVEAVAKSFLQGNAAKMPGTSWSNQGSINTGLIARVTQNLAASFDRAPEDLEVALAEQGLSWGPPFPPGRPLDPFWGYRRAPRTWDFAVGENVQLTPRWNRISFPTLKALVDSYYVAQICIRHLINDVRSLDYQFVPPQNVQEDATDDIEKAEAFFRYPDRRQPFRAWLAEYLQDVLRYDAGTLYIRRDEADRPIALEVVSGATIIPLVDFFGRSPADEVDDDLRSKITEIGGLWTGKTVPAFVQIIEGMPWVWNGLDEVIYQPWNPLPDSQYGLAPMEAVLLQANTDIRFQWHFLQYFTEGTLPAGFMEAPPDLSDPNQVAEWQETWDAVMEGDQSKLRQIRWVPNGAKFTPVKNSDFNPEFPLYLMRCVAAAFGVTPNDLGFTEDVNRSTGDTQIDVQFRVGTLPLIRHVEDLLNAFIAEHLGLKARLQFDIGREVEDRLVAAQAEDIRIKNGTMSTDEARMRLGLRISRERPVPRYINNERGGPVPLIALQSLAGKIDPTTYGPAKDQQLIDHPFIAAPGIAPVPQSNELHAAQDATANMQRNMLIQNADPHAPGQAVRADGTVQTTPEIPQPSTTVAGVDATAQKALSDAFSIIDLLLDRIEKESTDNTGGPGVTRGFSNPLTVDTNLKAEGAVSAGGEGVTVATGIAGEDLIDEDGEATQKALTLATELRRWKENAKNRVRKGQSPRRFDDLPSWVADGVWAHLEHATTAKEVDAAFLSWAKGDPKALARA